MKRMRSALGPALFALALLPGDSRAQTSLEDEVMAALEAYVLAINADDPDKLAALYLNSPTVASVGDGRIYRGWSTVDDLLRGIYQQSGAVRLGGENVAITPLGSDAAVVYFDTQWTLGREVQTTNRGAMTMVFVRTQDGWKVAHDHTSTLPGSTAAATLPRLPGPIDGPTGPVRTTQPCTVVRVVDGDTIECAPVGRIRLVGMDTPEGGQKPYGSMATQALTELLPADLQVEVEADVENRDRYGRALRYVWSGGLMLNWALVRNGYAVMLTYPPNVQYVDWFRSAQEAARDEGAGLWAIDGFDCSPRAYRRGECR